MSIMANEYSKIKCCICGKMFSEYGNSPYPVKNAGVCCDACNRDVVIPRRLALMRIAREHI